MPADSPFATWWGGVGLESLWEINILKFQIQFKGSKKSKATENQTSRRLRQGFSPSFGLIKSALSQTKAGRLKSCAAECSRLLSQVGIWHWRHLIQPQTERISCLIDAILSISLHSLPTFGPLFQMQLPACSKVFYSKCRCDLTLYFFQTKT